MDAHIGSYIFYEDLYWSNRTTLYVVLFVSGMLFAQDLIVGILIPSFNLITGKSLYSFRNTSSRN